jgi:hypothetical protein
MHHSLSLRSALGGPLAALICACTAGESPAPNPGTGGEDGSGRGGSGGGPRAGGAPGGGGASGGSGTGGVSAGGSGGASGSGAGGSGGVSAGSGGGTADGPAVMGDTGIRDVGVAADRAGDAAPGASSFSFFVVSLKALQTLSNSPNGFGGNLTFGQADGLAGADEICRRAAEMGMPGAGQRQWRAFLSTVKGPVHARDRIGAGPWRDRNGRLVAATLDDLFAGARPRGDAMTVNDLPNERGEPNHYVGAAGYSPGQTYDTHDTLTASDTMGRLRAAGMADTCNDWTSTTATGRPWIGHSWPRSANSGIQWASDHQTPGCAPGIDRTLGGNGPGNCIGCAGGYGGFYCFALP